MPIDFTKKENRRTFSEDIWTKILELNFRPILYKSTVESKNMVSLVHLLLLFSVCVVYAMASIPAGAREGRSEGSNDAPPEIYLKHGILTPPQIILVRNIFWYTPTRNLHHNCIIF